MGWVFRKLLSDCCVIIIHTHLLDVAEGIIMFNMLYQMVKFRPRSAALCIALLQLVPVNKNLVSYLFVS